MVICKLFLREYLIKIKMVYLINHLLIYKLFNHLWFHRNMKELNLLLLKIRNVCLNLLMCRPVLNIRISIKKICLIKVPMYLLKLLLNKHNLELQIMEKIQYIKCMILIYIYYLQYFICKLVIFRQIFYIFLNFRKYIV